MVKRGPGITFGTIIFAIFLSLLSKNTVFAIEEDTNFNVNVKEILSVSISTPTDWATGDADAFLRNKVSLNVVSNNANGFIAFMTTKTPETSLINTSKNTFTLPTLAVNTTRANFPANYWGYSLDDTEVGSGTSSYRPLIGSNGTPITILSSPSASSGSKDFYFGAKANITKAAGTYTGTVVISVVSGVNSNPTPPVDPVTPSSDSGATYNSSTDTTAYTYYASGSGVSTTTTEVSSGDNRSAYEGYTPPQGVTHTITSRVANSSPLATGLGVTATVAAASGAVLLFAVRRDDSGDS